MPDQTEIVPINSSILSLLKGRQKMNNARMMLKAMEKRGSQEIGHCKSVDTTVRTSFILENLRVKFKITIGNELQCTSNTNQRHCAHFLYALMQIFYLLDDHPLFFCRKYTNKELRYIIANCRINNNNVLDYNQSRPKLPHNVIFQEEGQDEEEVMCAICHMQIISLDDLPHEKQFAEISFTWIASSMGKAYQNKDGIVNCPLCRDEKLSRIFEQIRQKEMQHRDQKTQKKIEKEYNYYCDGCQLRRRCTPQKLPRSYN